MYRNRRATCVHSPVKRKSILLLLFKSYFYFGSTNVLHIRNEYQYLYGERLCIIPNLRGWRRAGNGSGLLRDCRTISRSRRHVRRRANGFSSNIPTTVIHARRPSRDRELGALELTRYARCLTPHCRLMAYQNTNSFQTPQAARRK